FGKGVAFKQRTALGMQASREVILFHRDTIAKDPDLFSLGAPDIMVAKLPGDIYRVGFNTEKVDPSLVSGIEEEIRRAYSERDGK
ncbi:MAG: hypothetical protein Q8O89_03405, partial [Nanoarchaeota archaeon]|nr:hypothetical protein [Nanoarchaeota archaeon]